MSWNVAIERDQFQSTDAATVTFDATAQFPTNPEVPMKAKLPTNQQPGLNPTTNSVTPDIGRTAAEGARQGKQANDLFHEQQARDSRRQQPGNSPYTPE